MLKSCVLIWLNSDLVHITYYAQANCIIVRLLNMSKGIAEYVIYYFWEKNQNIAYNRYIVLRKCSI